ncbi:MAG: hypothetical protein ACTSYB_02275, partial [Candidatus Helarchaeota archaeon]
MVDIPFSFNRIETFRILTIGYLLYIPFLWYSGQMALFEQNPIFYILFGLILSLLLYPLLYFPVTLVQTYLEKIIYWEGFPKIVGYREDKKSPTSSKAASNTEQSNIKNQMKWEDVQESYKRATIIWATLDLPQEIKDRIVNYKNISTLLFNCSYISLIHTIISCYFSEYPLYLLPITFALICYVSFGAGIYYHCLSLFSEISMFEQEKPKKEENGRINKEIIIKYEENIWKLKENYLFIRPLSNKNFKIFMGSFIIILIIILFHSINLLCFPDIDWSIGFVITTLI